MENLANTEKITCIPILLNYISLYMCHINHAFICYCFVILSHPKVLLRDLLLSEANESSFVIVTLILNYYKG